MSEGISSFNPAKRRLCPDGACIGVIGDDGRCRVCGTTGTIGTTATPAADGTTPVASSPAIADFEDDGVGVGVGGDDAGPVITDDDDDQPAIRAAEENGRAMPGADEAGFRPDRKLCDDGSCVGVIGADGLCSVCGRRAES